MGSRVDLLTPSLLRMDGRRPFEFRSLEIHFDPEESADGTSFQPQGPSSSTNRKADGSIRWVQGLNDVSANVFGPEDSQLLPPPQGTVSGGGNAMASLLAGEEGAKLEIELRAENASAVGGERKGGGKADRRTQDLLPLLHQTLLPLLSLHLYPRNSTLHLTLEITSSDGSLFSSLVNASTLAFIQAGLPMKDLCLSLTIAFHPQAFLLDPTSQEANDLPTITLIVAPNESTLISMFLDAGRGKVEGTRVKEAIKVGLEVCSGRWREEVEGAVRGWGQGLIGR